MKVSYYPGCSLEGTAREYSASTEAAAHHLGVSLNELDGWNCCGASSAHAVSDELGVALPARNLRIAEKAGMDLVVPCAACYNRLKLAEKKLLSGEAVDGVTAAYKGPRIRYLVEFFWEDVGEKAVKAQVKQPLTGLKAVCYYGCLTSRPPAVTGARRPEDPTGMDGLVKTLGAEVKNWSYKTQCCGGDLALTRPDIAGKMVKRLLDAAVEAGADCIVTGCPLCQANLDMKESEMLNQDRTMKVVPVLYFTELMGLAFGDGSVDKWLRGHMIDPRPLLHEKGLLKVKHG